MPKLSRRCRNFLKSIKNKILFKNKNKDISVIRAYELFDKVWYLHEYPDVAQAKIDPLTHFVLHGFEEGRKPYVPFQQLEKTSICDGKHYELSIDVIEQIEAAAQFEPEVAGVLAVGQHLQPPFYDTNYYLHKRLKERLPAFDYDTIICAPWIRMGGSDYIAGQLAHSLRRLLPGEKILFLRTETEHLERPEWLPGDIDNVDLSDLLAQCDQRSAEFLLYVMFIGLRPKRIVNINSLKCWHVFRRFGERLANFLNLYAYLFCWDLTETGVRGGYPGEFYPATGGFLSAIFTDSLFLKMELTRLYAVPPSLESKIVPLFTPAYSYADATPPAAPAIGSMDIQKRPVVLWAGRLDRQKRFDLVLDIAAKMPQVDFLCWGQPVLDGPTEPYTCPPNVVLKPAFRSLDEIPWADASVWLFTSAWEGTPTMLIQVALKGVPVVASAVGGVSELINDDTGWPVRSINDVDAYVASLQEAINHPRFGMERGLNLQRWAKSRHSVENYDAEIQRVLLQEKRHD
jgi:glycosyltransferase involved in cell wall biosynthesis